MRITLSALLSQKPFILADGATGTNFMDMDLEPGFPPDLWNLSEPHKPENLHQMFVDAGSDIILTNTFGANAPRLKLHQAEDQTYAVNKAGAEIAGQVAERAERAVVVAGSVGPTGELFEPMGALTPATAREFFAEQIRGLKDGGADVIWIETMSAREEIEAAALAAIDLDIPYVFTASFDSAGKTMMGIDPSGLKPIADNLPQKPIAYGANCGVGASDLAYATLNLSRTDPGGVLVGKANCGIPVIKGKETVYTGTPELMADYVRMLADIGIRIIGGCCGTRPAHIRAMRDALDNYQSGVRPNAYDIIEKLGPLAAPPATEETKAKARDRRRRGRRAE